MFIKCNFSTDYNEGSFTILIESLKFSTNSRIIVTYPGNLLWNVNMSFFIIMLCYYFSLEAVLQGMARNYPTEKQIEAKILKRH